MATLKDNMMSDRNIPVWLLDVDGVINASKPDKVWNDIATDYAYGGTGRYYLKWSPTLISRIRDMHLSGRVEVVWCTTWCDYAHNLEKLWELPKLNRAFTDYDENRSVTNVKVMAAHGVLNRGRRLIWTDDDVVPRMQHLFADEIDNGNALLIGPDEWFGLTKFDIMNIERFIGE